MKRLFHVTGENVSESRIPRSACCVASNDHVFPDVEEDLDCSGGNEAGPEEQKGILQMPFGKEWKNKKGAIGKILECPH